MRKVILCVAVSLDGLIEGPNGEYDWCLTDQDYGMSAFIKRIDTIFYGRKSYEMMLHAQQGGDINPYAKMKSYVFSNTLAKPFEGTELVSGDLSSKVNALKNQPGKDIWLWGGASLTTSFLNAGLIDEMILAVHPVVLGAGKPLFSNIDGRKHFTLRSSEAYSSGLVMLTYEAKK
ncbi:MAG TPA: dihydrofolate reductase family protein [Cyclobacteriaceae bacterium]|nr:dihydrofolate reductase family protein [Cyclobacteriaceae bacterium]HMV08401.1 dihydrofolate reductase family protein [Cyclobacteriaceae bacterium]HMV89672.1 dihydrofolate reductase family protein [Cyclobacteriaceae bacterium]HMX01174.1 dihydrofolate reductase family protein [Cyclobacteriaceae bacterium]HMX50577.1 dihydrofolate reductase family protein [Cyclobacteriaceae bacterium]